MTMAPEEHAKRLQQDIRALRARYDKLERGEIAILRRCKRADEVAIEGTYWRIAGDLSSKQKNLEHVVLLFPQAPHVTNQSFSFGRFLNRHLGDSDGAALKFRRLIDCRDRDDLDHRLRRILRLASGNQNAVDWGILGTDILWFFAESGAVRRRWAQNFYSPQDRATTAAIANAL